MTSKGLGEMLEGDSADTGAGKFPLVSMGGRAEGLLCADPGARTPICASGLFLLLSLYQYNKYLCCFSRGFQGRHDHYLTSGFSLDFISHMNKMPIYIHEPQGRIQFDLKQTMSNVVSKLMQYLSNYTFSFYRKDDIV